MGHTTGGLMLELVQRIPRPDCKRYGGCAGFDNCFHIEFDFYGLRQFKFLVIARGGRGACRLGSFLNG